MAFTTLGVFTPDDVLPYRVEVEDEITLLELRKGWFRHIGPQRTFIGEDGQPYKVNMCSQRYHLFAKQPSCACCGVTGTIMKLQKDANQWKAHFNLYADVNGSHILMTRDHILPKSKGGNDTLDNIQTLCTRCNEIKANREMTIEELQIEVQKRAISRAEQQKRIQGKSQITPLYKAFAM